MTPHRSRCRRFASRDRKPLDATTVYRIIAEALDKGCRIVQPHKAVWDCSGTCTVPYTVKLTGRPSRLPSGEWMGGLDKPVFLDMDTPCRKCPDCLRVRSWIWRVRCQHEIENHQRTWFGTLTLSPGEQYRALLEGLPGKLDDDEEEIVTRHRAASKWITKYLKRVRKESGAPLRYCLVLEAHKSGLPHYHFLMHEVDPEQPVRSRVLDHQWPHGHMQCRLVTHPRQSAGYVSKYLSKSALARIRASRGYGASACVTAKEVSDWLEGLRVSEAINLQGLGSLERGNGVSPEKHSEVTSQEAVSASVD